MKVPQSHNRHDLYTNNVGVSAPTLPLPLPPTKGLPFKINTYKDVDEPVFDPDVHLNLEMPKYVRVLPDFEPMDKTPCFANDQNGSRFAYSAPFQVFSQEGMRVIKKIIRREEKNIPIGPASSRGNKTILRGLYYVSPWIRDLQACKRLCDHFCEIAGEPLVPHPSFCNSPQVNLSIEGSKGPVDHWHYDSIAYTGVVLLNDVEVMEGGKLEIMHADKNYGLELLAQGKEYKAEAVGYEHPGRMILAQGSEILHHVTRVENNVERISLVFGYAPANCFRPPKTILKTHQRIDQVHKMANYEFFREKTWQGLHCLKHYVNTVPYTSNGEFLGEKLRVVAQELKRAADILQDKEDDTILVFDESKNGIETEYDTLADHHIRRASEIKNGH
jgi:hypothetical protein